MVKKKPKAPPAPVPAPEVRPAHAFAPFAPFACVFKLVLNPDCLDGTCVYPSQAAPAPALELNAPALRDLAKSRSLQAVFPPLAGIAGGSSDPDTDSASWTIKICEDNTKARGKINYPYKGVGITSTYHGGALLEPYNSFPIKFIEVPHFTFNTSTIDLAFEAMVDSYRSHFDPIYAHPSLNREGLSEEFYASLPLDMCSYPGPIAGLLELVESAAKLSAPAGTPRSGVATPRNPTDAPSLFPTFPKELVEACVMDVVTRSRVTTDHVLKEIDACGVSFDVKAGAFSGETPSNDTLYKVSKVLIDLGIPALTAVHAKVLKCDRANTFFDEATFGLGVPTYTYRTSYNAMDCRPLLKMIALVKEGLSDEHWDHAFQHSYAKHVDYMKEPVPTPWPIPPPDKDVLEEEIDKLLAETQDAFSGEDGVSPRCRGPLKAPTYATARRETEAMPGRTWDYRSILSVLKKHSWDHVDKMFTHAHVDWVALCNDLIALMPAIDYDFEVTLQVRHKGHVWSQELAKMAAELEAEGVKSTKLRKAFFAVSDSILGSADDDGLVGELLKKVEAVLGKIADASDKVTKLQKKAGGWVSHAGGTESNLNLNNHLTCARAHSPLKHSPEFRWLSRTHRKLTPCDRLARVARQRMCQSARRRPDGRCARVRADEGEGRGGQAHPSLLPGRVCFLEGSLADGGGYDESLRARYASKGPAAGGARGGTEDEPKA